MDNGIVYQGGGLRIAGTRITVYDIVHYLEAGRQPEEIAAILRLSLDQVVTAVRYIEEHKAEVMSVHRRIEERIARGNPPEIEAMRLATRARMQAWLRERQQESLPEAKSAGNASCQISLMPNGRLTSSWSTSSISKSIAAQDDSTYPKAQNSLPRRRSALL